MYFVTDEDFLGSDELSGVSAFEESEDDKKKKSDSDFEVADIHFSFNKNNFLDNYTH